MFVDKSELISFLEGCMPTKQFIEHYPYGINICPFVSIFATQPLRGHISWCSYRRGKQLESETATRSGFQDGNAKVNQLHLSSSEQKQIFWFDIPVNDSLCMCIR